MRFLPRGSTIGLALFALAGCARVQSARSLSSSELPQIAARQDQVFTYTLSDAGTGPFVITNLPAWASFNSTTGKITGTPSSMLDGFDFTASTINTPDSPVAYQVQIVGNPLKEYQWHLGNTGQTAFAYSGGIAGNDLHLSQSITAGLTGAGIKIAISDSGVVAAHEGLAVNMLAGASRNYQQNYSSTQTWIGDPTPDLTSADDAHGTAVAGLAAEVGWNGVGGRGVAPGSQLAGFLFIPALDNLSAQGLSTSAMLDQFSGSFDVFNYSWGDPQCSLTEYGSSLVPKLVAGVTSQRGGLGSIFVRAAGNSYYDSLTACYNSAVGSKFFGSAQSSELDTTPYTVEVAASNASGYRSSYSTPGANIWISTPGGEYGFKNLISGNAVSGMPALISTDYPGCRLGIKSFGLSDSDFDQGFSPNQSCNYTSTMNGTSGATPLASGSIALLLEANPNLGWRDVKHILATTADVIDSTVNPATHPLPSANFVGHVYEQGWITNGAGYHFMNYYGFGRINVDRAVGLARGYTSALGAFQQTGWSANDSGTISIAIPPNVVAGVNENLFVTQNLFVEAVQVRLAVSGCVSSVGIELVSPAGTRSHLANVNSNLQDTAIEDHTYLSNAFYGEPTNGSWTLNLINASATCTANLTHWALNFYGH